MVAEDGAVKTTDLKLIRMFELRWSFVSECVDYDCAMKTSEGGGAQSPAGNF